MRKIVIFGITGMSKVIAEYIRDAGKDEVCAYTVDEEYLTEKKEFNGLPLVAFESVQNYYPPGEYMMLNVLSAGSGQKHIVETKFKHAKQKGYELYTFIDPNAIVASSAKIGENCIICNSAIIEPLATIDNGVFVRSAAYISHETHIGTYTYIAPRVAFSGNVTVGKHCFIGTNATIRDKIKIGDDSIVGAGAVLLKDLPASSIYKAAVGSVLPIDRHKIKP